MYFIKKSMPDGRAYSVVSPRTIHPIVPFPSTCRLPSGSLFSIIVLLQFYYSSFMINKRTIIELKKNYN